MLQFNRTAQNDDYEFLFLWLLGPVGYATFALKPALRDDNRQMTEKAEIKKQHLPS